MRHGGPTHTPVLPVGVGTWRPPSAAESHHHPTTSCVCVCVVCAGDTKLGTTDFVNLWVVAAYNYNISVIVTDPALRLANATELAAEAPNMRPTIGYVYA